MSRLQDGAAFAAAPGAGGGATVRAEGGRGRSCCCRVPSQQERRPLQRLGAEQRAPAACSATQRCSRCSGLPAAPGPGKGQVLFFLCVVVITTLLSLLCPNKPAFLLLLCVPTGGGPEGEGVRADPPQLLRLWWVKLRRSYGDQQVREAAAVRATPLLRVVKLPERCLPSSSRAAPAPGRLSARDATPPTPPDAYAQTSPAHPHNTDRCSGPHCTPDS